MRAQQRTATTILRQQIWLFLVAILVVVGIPTAKVGETLPRVSAAKPAALAIPVFPVVTVPTSLGGLAATAETGLVAGSTVSAEMIAGAFLLGFAGGYYGSQFVYNYVQGQRVKSACGSATACWGPSTWFPSQADVDSGTLDASPFGCFHKCFTVTVGGDQLYQARFTFRDRNGAIVDEYVGTDFYWTNTTGCAHQTGLPGSYSRTNYGVIDSGISCHTTYVGYLTDVSFLSTAGVGAEWHADLSSAPKSLTPTMTCRRPDGTLFTWRGAPVPMAAGSTTVPGLSWPSCDSLSQNSWRTTAGVDGGMQSGPQRPLITIPTFKPGVDTSNPACAGAAATFGPCTVQLWKGTRTCMTSMVDCSAFPQSTAGFTCKWGPTNGTGTTYSLPISDCTTVFKSMPTRRTVEQTILVDRIREGQPSLSPADAQTAAQTCLAQQDRLVTQPGYTGSATPCLSYALFFPGANAGGASLHDRDTIATNPKWAMTTYMSPPDKKASGVRRDWYDVAAYRQFCAVDRVARGFQCDEYPFYTSVEGGPGASLREVVIAQNSSEGGSLSALQKNPKCVMATNSSGALTYPGSKVTKFLTVPLAVKNSTTDPDARNWSFSGPPSFHVCADSRSIP